MTLRIPNALLGPEEFHRRFAGRFFGKHRAIVSDVSDPQKRNRIRVRCEGVYGADLSPWALPNAPLAGMPETGAYMVPPVGSFVWVEFEEGKPEHPIYSGGFWEEALRGRGTDGSPIENTPEFQRNRNPLPAHAQGLPDGTDFDGTVRGVKGAPASGFSGEYPNVRGFKSPAGHVVELDDTEGQERIRVMHKSGTTVEFLPDGSLVEIVDGVRTSWTRGHNNTVVGNYTQSTRGSRVETIEGDYRLVVKGRFDLDVQKSSAAKSPGGTEAIAGDWIKEVAGQVKIEALGNVQITSGGDLPIAAFGNAAWSIGGAWSVGVADTMNALNPATRAVDLFGLGGRSALRSSDPTGQLSSYGIEASGQEAPTNSVVPSPFGVGPFVRLGNLSVPPVPQSVPLVQEPAAMGLQVWQYLQGLQAFLQTWLTDYLSHAHPWYSPSYTSVAMATTLPPALAALNTTWLTPAAPKKHPLILSDVVFLSKS